MQLLEYLKLNKVSDEDFAAGIGATSHAVRKWKYRERSPSAKVIFKIKELTGGAVTLEDWIVPKSEAA